MFLINTVRTFFSGFYVGSKWFCFVNIEVFDFCCIKSDPNESGRIASSILWHNTGWHMNKKYWISGYFNQDACPTTDQKSL